MSRDRDSKNYDLGQFFFLKWVFWSDDSFQNITNCKLVQVPLTKVERQTFNQCYFISYQVFTKQLTSSHNPWWAPHIFNIFCIF